MRTHSLLYNDATDLKRSLQAARIRNNEHLLVQVFSGNPDIDYLYLLLHEIHSLLPNCSIIGTTSAGEIYQGMVLENSTIITFIQFDQASFSLSHVNLDYHPNSLEAGQLLGLQLCESASPALILCYATGFALNAETLARGIVKHNPDCYLAGGLAAAPKPQQTSLVFYNDTLLTAGAVAVGISGQNLHPTLHFSPDWMMLGTPMQITETDENRLKSINETPALEIFQRYLGDDAGKGMNNACMQFPLLTERNGRLTARKCKAAHRDGSITFSGELQPGESVRFGIVDPVSAMDASKQLFEHIQHDPPGVVFMYPSQARKVLLRSLTADDAKLLHGVAPTTGFVTLGQFYYTPEHQDFLHYAQVVLTISEGGQRRLHLTKSESKTDYSEHTLEMRALSHLVNTTSRELEEANQSLERLANTDALTGAYNRRKMLDILDVELKRAQRYGRSFSIIMFDIDDFKKVNDQYGHQAGDDVLTKLVEIVQEKIRDTDSLSRWGGEEFLILCPETDLQGAYENAERIREAVMETKFNDKISTTLSMGVTSYQPEDNLDEILKRADQGLYHSKDSGKNHVTNWE
ncbi:MAG TPA: GGDEF domain-containing protein [Chromatiales bacterium]|nr:GGDEF domain-containing protein [Thiotrichales bacterium]HIP68222.1 GGDEF domain-containing protein [Chromatiales bacterium]